MEKGLLEVRNVMIPLVEETASYIHNFLYKREGAERRRQVNAIVSSLNNVKISLQYKDRSGGEGVVEREATDIDAEYVGELMDMYNLNHKFDVTDLVQALAKSFKTLNPNCEIDSEEGLSEETLTLNRGKFRQHVISFIDLLVEEITVKELGLNLSINSDQTSAIDKLSERFLGKVDAKRVGDELNERRAKLSTTLLKIAAIFTQNDKEAEGIFAGGTIERELGKTFKDYLGTEPVFGIKRLAFPNGNEYAELKDKLVQSIEREREIKTGGVIVVFDDFAKVVIGYEVKSINDGKILAKKYTIESKTREPQNFVISNIPEYVITDDKEAESVVEFEIDSKVKIFGSLTQLSSFLMVEDLRRYKVYTNMCKYFVSSLIKKIKRGI